MPLEIVNNKNLAPLTTMKLGGDAKFFCEVKNVEELKEALAWAKENEHPVHILAGGSNTIFSDSGFLGLVIKMNLLGISFDGGIATVAAGENWDNFVRQAVERGLQGVECMSGVPGSVGATPIQNVGAYGQEVAQVIQEVKVLDKETLAEHSFTAEECNFSYRQSRFKQEDAGKYIVTEVTFKLTPGGQPNLSYPQVAEALAGNSQPTLEDVRQAVLGLRKKKSMIIDEADVNSRSCGSFFVNPVLSQQKNAKLPNDAPTFVDDASAQERIPAAWLVEQAGYPRGWQRDGVGISENHNLALVNKDGSAEKLLALAEEIKNAVRTKYGIELEREPVVV